jgi:hypothetical protein
VSRTPALVVAALIVVSCGGAPSSALSVDPLVLGASIFTLDAITWRAFSVSALEGQTFVGTFSATSDGSLYPGDEQKYDNWVPIVIRFMILDSEQYSSFANGSEAFPTYSSPDTSEISWRFEVPHTGIWYLTYGNPSIYMVEVESQVGIPSSWSTAVPALLLLGISAFFGLGLLVRKRKGIPFIPRQRVEALSWKESESQSTPRLSVRRWHQSHLANLQ